MSAPAIQFARRAPNTLLRVAPDRRRHKRVAVTLLGRFMRANKHEYPCKLLDISVGGAAIMSPTTVDIAERIVVYFDQIGGHEGTVARVFDGGFGLQFSATQHRREKLAAQLIWLLNRNELGGLEERRHERVVPKNSSSTVTLADGLTIACQVNDVSISGASIATSARPAVGQDVVIGGKVRGRVVRHHTHGIGVQFVDMQSPNTIKRYFE